MTTIAIGAGRGGPGRRVRPVAVRITAVLLAAWLLTGRPAGSASAEVLRWKFKPGEVLHYAMEQKTVTNVKGVDRESKSTRSLTIDMSWKVNSVTGAGDAEITQRVDRVRMRLEEPPFMPFEFDSSNPKIDAQSPFAAAAEQVKALSGSEFSFRMKPSGQIEDITFPEKTLKSLRDAAPKGSPEGDVSEKALKDLLLQSSPPAFPEGSLEPGKTWTNRPAKVPIGFGTIVMDRTFTFQGPDPKAPRRLLVGIDTKVTLEPADGANISAAIRSQSGEGTITFDAEAGRIVSTRGVQKMEMLITVMAQRLAQSTETTTTMSLAP
jgi:hypothetical protein